MFLDEEPANHFGGHSVNFHTFVATAFARCDSNEAVSGVFQTATPVACEVIRCLRGHLVGGAVRRIFSPSWYSPAISSRLARGCTRTAKLTVPSFSMICTENYGSPLAPNSAVPTRTSVAPSSMAISKSWDMPIESAGRISGPIWARTASRNSRRRREVGLRFLGIVEIGRHTHQAAQFQVRQTHDGFDQAGYLLAVHTGLRGLRVELHLD